MIGDASVLVAERGAGPAIEEALVEASGGVIIVSEPANSSSLRGLSEEVNNTRGHPERRVRLIERFGHRQIVRVLNEDQLQTAKLPNIASDGSITYRVFKYKHEVAFIYSTSVEYTS
jgi:hypothetical protein